MIGVGPGGVTSPGQAEKSIHTTARSGRYLPKKAFFVLNIKNSFMHKFRGSSPGYLFFSLLLPI
jgi:hypothetical protein